MLEKVSIDSYNEQLDEVFREFIEDEGEYPDDISVHTIKQINKQYVKNYVKYKWDYDVIMVDEGHEVDETDSGHD